MRAFGKLLTTSGKLVRTFGKVGRLNGDGAQRQNRCLRRNEVNDGEGWAVCRCGSDVEARHILGGDSLGRCRLSGSDVEASERGAVIHYPLSTSAALWVKGEGFFLFSYCEKTEKFFFCPDFLSISVRNAMMSRWKMLIINFYCLFRQAENAVIGIIFCNFAAKL